MLRERIESHVKRNFFKHRQKYTETFEKENPRNIFDAHKIAKELFTQM